MSYSASAPLAQTANPVMSCLILTPFAKVCFFFLNFGPSVDSVCHPLYVSFFLNFRHRLVQYYWYIETLRLWCSQPWPWDLVSWLKDRQQQVHWSWMRFRCLLIGSRAHVAIFILSTSVRFNLVQQHCILCIFAEYPQLHRLRCPFRLVGW